MVSAINQKALWLAGRLACFGTLCGVDDGGRQESARPFTASPSLRRIVDKIMVIIHFHLSPRVEMRASVRLLLLRVRSDTGFAVAARVGVVEDL